MFRRGRSDTRNELWKDFEAEALPCLSDLHRLAVWLTRNRDEAEDLVQETMAEALRSFHRYERGTNCRAWLATIMYHRNSKRLARIGRMRIVAETEEKMAETLPFEPPLPQNLTDEEIITALRRLPEIFRQVVVLSDVEEFSYKEIASILGIPMGTVMSRLSRGRKVLRFELAEYARDHGFGDDRQIAAG
ncbi:MAG TPA: sigma-70 family RNA polymerase sigma factor [Pyrinomonadaceae bacterium]|nr:sigma-70 family RNA polymerase sigma factor [Pyrinomonadaceae bacterium]